MRRIIVFLLLVSVGANAQLNSIALNGDNFVNLTGAKFGNKKIVFSKVSGDWFATAKDAHASLSMVGPFDSRPLTFTVEWDGINDPHVITNELRHTAGRKGEFTLTVPDGNTYGDGLIAYPADEEEATIKVTRIDDTNLQAEISGIISNNGDRFKVSGIINLKKNAPAKTVAFASYKDCDNVLHDKLIGAESRSPTDCEIKFILDLTKNLHDAFSPVIDHFLKKGWTLDEETPAKPIMEINRGSEKSFIDPAFTDLDNYKIHLKLDPASKEYGNWSNQIQDLMAEFSKDPMNKGIAEKIKTFRIQQNAAVDIEIMAHVNRFTLEADNFTSNHRLENPGKGYSSLVYLNNGAASTGGDPDDAESCSWVLFGKWTTPKFTNNGDGSERISAIATTNKLASHLSVQAYMISIKCNDELAKEILQYTDLNKLQSLLQ